MLSINLYEEILKNYLNFEKYLNTIPSSEFEKKMTKQILEFKINGNVDDYTLYRTLMDLVKEKDNAKDISDEEYIRKILKIGYGKYLEYDDSNIEEILEDYDIEDISLDYFINPNFINALKNNHVSVKNARWNDDNYLNYVPISFRDNEEFLRKIDNLILTDLISERLRNKAEFVLNCKIDDFNIIGEDLKNNRSFILALVEINPFMLRKVSKKFRDDKEIILRALVNDNQDDSFNYLWFRNDKSEEELIYESMSEDLQRDEEVVWALIKSDYYVYRDLFDEFKENRKIIEYVLSKDIDLAEYLPEIVKNDSKYLDELYKKYDFSLFYATDIVRKKYLDDLEIVKKELGKNPRFVKYLGEDLLNNKDFWINVLSGEDIVDFGDFVMEYIGDNLKNDEDFMMKALEVDFYGCENYIGDKLRDNDKIIEKVKELEDKYGDIF